MRTTDSKYFPFTEISPITFTKYSQAFIFLVHKFLVIFLDRSCLCKLIVNYPLFTHSNTIPNDRNLLVGFPVQYLWSFCEFQIYFPTFTSNFAKQILLHQWSEKFSFKKWSIQWIAVLKNGIFQPLSFTHSSRSCTFCIFTSFRVAFNAQSISISWNKRIMYSLPERDTSLMFFLSFQNISCSLPFFSLPSTLLSFSSFIGSSCFSFYFFSQELCP